MEEQDQARGPTHAQLANLNDTSRGDAGRTSRKTYDAALNARWAKFADAEDTSYDALKAQLLTSSLDVNAGLIERFFLAMWDDLKTNKGRVYGLTKSACDTATKAMLLWVNDALLSAGQNKIDSIKTLVSLFAQIGSRCGMPPNCVLKVATRFVAKTSSLLNLGGGPKSLV
jgi:hypothetical protein